MSRGKGPESLYLNNMGVFAPTQMGDFTPSAGLMGEMQPLSNQPEDVFQTPNQRGFQPGGSMMPTAQNVVIEDRMAQDNPNYRAEPAQEAGAAPQRTLGLLGDMFGGASALDEYMTPEQRAQMQNQGVMAAAMQLLASSSPSRTPVGLGQALGQAYGAGQQGYTAAQQNLLQSMSMKQKMDEYKRARTIEGLISGALTGETAAPGAEVSQGAAVSPTQITPTSVTGLQEPPQEVPAMASAAAKPPSQAQLQHDRYMKASLIAAQVGDPTKAKAYSDLAKQILPLNEVVGEPFLGTDNTWYSRLKSGGAIPFGGAAPPAAKPTGEPKQQLVDGKAQMVQYFNDGTFKVVPGIGQVAKPQGAPIMQMKDGVPTMMQYYDDGTSKPITGVSQYNAPSSDVINYEYITGKSMAGTGAPGLAALERAKKAGATTVSINTGEKGFQHEFDLKKSFGNEPIYKDYQSMKSALSAVQASLKSENPIGDVAAATKIMKLLDPGSVVRESELGIAMAATGKMDILSNYVDMWKSGRKLTPTQRAEFGALSNELYNASAKAYNDKRNEYAAFGAKYEIDANTALGNTAPVVPFTPPAAAGGGTRPPLSSIIRPRGAP